MTPLFVSITTFDVPTRKPRCYEAANQMKSFQQLTVDRIEAHNCNKLAILKAIRDTKHAENSTISQHSNNTITITI